MFNQTIVFKNPKKISFIYLSFLFFINIGFATENWQRITNGIDYMDLAKNKAYPQWSHIHAFKVNLKVNYFDLILAKDLQQQVASVEEFSTIDNPLIAINGGFFDHQFQPLGLRVQNYQQKNPFKAISWWGIFLIKNNQPSIIAAKNFKQNSQISFAIQSGPRLLINGKIPSLKPGVAERTALCITPSNDVIIVVTENFTLSTNELAQQLQKPPLNCNQALNLDGGKSSQVFANIGEFKVHAPGFSRVSDAVIVKAIKHGGVTQL